MQSTLTSDLDHLFSVILGSLTDVKAGKVSELERAKLYVDLTECLRIYDSLRLWRVAEEIMRREVMQTFIKKVWDVLTSFSERNCLVLHPRLSLLMH